MQGARDEAEAMMCKAVEELLEATGTRPEDIGVLVVNCSRARSSRSHSRLSRSF